MSLLTLVLLLSVSLTWCWEVTTKQIFQNPTALSFESVIKRASGDEASNLSYRFFLDPSDHQNDLVVDVDYASWPITSKTLRFLDNGLLEVTIDMDATDLQAGSSITLHTRIHTKNYEALDFSNDPSLKVLDGSLNTDVVLLLNGNVVFGEENDGGEVAVADTILDVKLYSKVVNVSDYHVEYEFELKNEGNIDAQDVSFEYLVSQDANPSPIVGNVDWASMPMFQPSVSSHIAGSLVKFSLTNMLKVGASAIIKARLHKQDYSSHSFENDYSYSGNKVTLALHKTAVVSANNQIVSTPISVKNQISMKIAEHLVGDLTILDDEYLDLIVRSGYTHLMVALSFDVISDPSEWVNGEYQVNHSSPGRMHIAYLDLLQRAYAKGLHVIPHLDMGTTHSQSWGYADPKQTVLSRFDHEFANGKAVVTPFAADPDGFDKSFASVINALDELHYHSGATFPIDYIHIGHDELVAYWDGCEIRRLAIALTPGKDREAIIAYGENEAAYARLYAEEVARRVDAIKAVLPSAKVLMWVDMFDPEFQPKSTIQAWTSKGFIDISLAAVLDHSEFQRVRADVFPMLWSYQEFAFPRINGAPYEPQKAIKFFWNKGLQKVFVAHAYDGEFDESHDQTYKFLFDNRDMNRLWSKAVSEGPYANSVIGAASIVWWDRDPEVEGGPGIQWNTHKGHRRFQVYSEFSSWLKSLGGWSALDFMMERVDDDYGLDLVQLWENGRRLGVEVYKSKGTLFDFISGKNVGGNSVLKFLSGDVNGDVNGKNEIIQLWKDPEGVVGKKLSIEVYASNGSSYDLYSHTNQIGRTNYLDFLTEDYNQDGKTDIFHFWDDQYQENGKTVSRLSVEVYTSNGVGFDHNSHHPRIGGSSNLEFFVTDLDGGSPEILQLWNDGGRLSIETYKVINGSYQLLSSSANIGGSAYIRFFIGDVDGDGATDIVQIWNDRSQPASQSLAIEVYGWNGQQFSHKSHYSIPFGSGGEFYSGDVNNDGNLDLVQIWKDGNKKFVGVETYIWDGTGFQFNNDIARYSLPERKSVRYFLKNVDGINGLELVELWKNGDRLYAQTLYWDAQLDQFR